MEVLKKPRRSANPARALDANESRALALAAASAGLEKKALDVQIIDVRGRVDYADFLVLMTGHSDRHVTTLAQSIDAALEEMGHRALSVEGLARAQWVLIDFVDVVVHVFHADTRPLYDLDGLWLDAQRVPAPSVPSKP